MFVLQNKNKKLESAKDGGGEVVIKDPSSPDTGQNQNQNLRSAQENAACKATSPSAESSPSSGHATLANSDNYNLVGSLLNLTKSPVSATQ